MISECKRISQFVPLLLLGATNLVRPLEAQWTQGGSGATYHTGGNVGIGTTTPQAGLDVAAGGIGIHGVSYTTGGAALELNIPSPNLAQISSVIGSTRAVNALGIWGSPTIFYTSAGTNRPVMSFLNSGNVGIGTATPQHLLHVAGTIGAQEVIVSSNGADYVFEPGYRLTSLMDVATYIRENHHLPDVPSAAEVKEKGAGLSEMQTKLLAKIEELTLHLIEEHERNDRLEEETKRLRDRLELMAGSHPSLLSPIK